MTENVYYHGGEITPEARERAFGHGARVLWFTGLSGSGKSTIARAVEAILVERRCFAYVLDGDNLRLGLNADLGFSEEHRRENIRRVGEVAALFHDAGALVLAAFVSPFRSDRDAVRAKLPAGHFFEIFVDTPLAECEARDPKGLYKKARAGEITNFTGVQQVYEPPINPELVLETDGVSVDACAAKVIAVLERGGVLGASEAPAR